MVMGWKHKLLYIEQPEKPRKGGQWSYYMS